MRKATLVVILVPTALICSPLFITLGMQIGLSSLYSLGIWIFAIAIAVFFVYSHRIYQRLETRTKRADQLLRDLQTSQKLLESRVAVGSNPRSSTDVQTDSTTTIELANISARLQRAERRIMGLLENEALSNDKLLNQIDHLLRESSAGQEDTKHSSTD